MPAETKIEQAPLPTQETPAIGSKLESEPVAGLEKAEIIKSAAKQEKVKEPAPVLTAGQSSLSASADSYQRRREEAIENVLAEGLDQVFLKMDPTAQRNFQKEGEKTASKINQLLNKAKVGADKVIALIRRWLGLIPGMNKFFLEQEAKIKADKILKIKKSL